MRYVRGMVGFTCRRNARGTLASKQQQKSLEDVRPDNSPAKVHCPKDTSKRQDTWKRGAVGGQVQRLVGRTFRYNALYCLSVSLKSKWNGFF